jgi:succinate dehydrogenase/fumarate reductase cytochrome b subunit
MVFLVFHLGVAALAASPARFEAIATKLHRLGAAVPLLLLTLLVLLAAVAITGVRVFLRGRPAMRRDESPLRLLAQRWTGVLVLGFMAVHIAMALMRGPGNTPASAGATLFAGNSLLVAFYAICLPAIAWHAGHGIWTGASVWGLRESNPAFWRTVAVIIGLLLVLLGSVALRALSA